jgi:hypothetical protein
MPLAMSAVADLMRTLSAARIAWLNRDSVIQRQNSGRVSNQPSHIDFRSMA